LDSLGIKKLFHKVAIKPGKPFWFGKFENGPTVFALPGNPFSTFVTFNLFILPFLHKCLSKKVKSFSKSTLQGEKVKKTPLDEFFPVRFCDFERKLTATALNGSGDIRLGIDADAIALHPSSAPGLAEGCELEYFRL
jgi:molybdopterin molybdotransferase